MRCPSVCLSVTFVDSVETNKLTFKLFSPPDSHAILVLLYQTSWQYSDSNPPNRSVECRWVRQKSRFPTNIWLHRVLSVSTLRSPGVINTAPPDRGKLWHSSVVVSGGACWWRETTTKCLSQEASTCLPCLVLTLCGLALRSTRMTRPRVQRTSPWRNPSLWI